MNDDQKFLFETAVTGLVEYVMKFESQPMPKAFKIVYGSKLHRRLSDPATHLYSEGPVYLYDMLCEERGIKNSVV